MTSIPFVDIHTHSFQSEKETIVVRNLFPGESFAAFSGRNFYSVGLHPWHIKNEDENNHNLEIVKEALSFNHVIFVGESGLDKNVNTDFNEQKRVFEAQILLAEEFNYPLIIHCVKAFNELITYRKKYHPKQPWIIHGFNRKKELAQQLINENFMFSFGAGILKNPYIKEALKVIPIEKLFFETDEFDGEVEIIYKQAAQIRGIPIDELKLGVWNNFNLIENSLSR